VGFLQAQRGTTNRYKGVIGILDKAIGGPNINVAVIEWAAPGYETIGHFIVWVTADDTSQSCIVHVIS
jgi:hypothetical protein